MQGFGRMFIQPAKSVQGEYTPPGDKSISHRAVMLGSLSDGTLIVENPCPGEDFLSTVRCMRDLGVPIEMEEGCVVVYGQGRFGLNDPGDVLNAGNSATTMRLLAGILAGQPFTTCLTGDNSLCRRPMRRIIHPLTLMGAEIEARKAGYPPLIIRGGDLQALSYRLPLPSAQVKSAILFAGLFARGVTEVIDPRPSRNHTELMLKTFGASIEWRDGRIRVRGRGSLRSPGQYRIPGDFSSAAFMIAAALLLPGSDLVIRGVCLNPTRIGLLNVIHAMGGRVQIIRSWEHHGEPVGDLSVRFGELKGTRVPCKTIGCIIDEIPLVALLGSRAQGTTVVRHARDLRVKESDRIQGIVQNFRAVGLEIEEFPDGFKIQGPQTIRGGRVRTFGDHRMAMTFAVAGLASQNGVHLDDPECVAISNPGFFDDMRKLVAEKT